MLNPISNHHLLNPHNLKECLNENLFYFVFCIAHLSNSFFPALHLAA